MTQVPSPPTLSEVLSARLTNAPAAAHWSEADRALLSEDYISAAIGYAAAADPSPVERAKHGFCLGMQGDDDGAEALLDEANVGSHPEAQALLAWVLGGTWGRRMRGGLGNPSAAQRAARKAATQDSTEASSATSPRTMPSAIDSSRTAMQMASNNPADCHRLSTLSITIQPCRQ